MKKILIIIHLVMTVIILTEVFILRIAKTPQGYYLVFVSIVFSVIISVILFIVSFYGIKKDYLLKKMEERSLKKHSAWVACIKEILEKNQSNFAERINQIIKERTENEKAVYILCSPSSTANKGFWLYFDSKRDPSLLISDAGECGISSFTYTALDYLTKSNLEKTELIIRETLNAEIPHIKTEETV